jgi:hypothetical protein
MKKGKALPLPRITTLDMTMVNVSPLEGFFLLSTRYPFKLIWWSSGVKFGIKRETAVALLGTENWTQ